MTPEEWQALGDAVTDAALDDFRSRICVQPCHVGTCAIGSCRICRGATPSTSMRLCDACASRRGVCPYDELLAGWGEEAGGDPVAAAALWLALLRRGFSAEREAARKALATFRLPGLEAASQGERAPGSPVRSPAAAEFLVLFGRLPEGLTVGERFANGLVVHLNPKLNYVVVRTEDAARFEEEAAALPGVQHVGLNRTGARMSAI